MTTADLTAPADTSAITHRRPTGFRAVLHDGRIVAWRNLVQLTRTPGLIIFTLIQPVMFVVLFNYVFGGAIGTALPPGVSYAQFLIPGVMVQALVFGSSTTSVGLADDLQKGIVDRFRSLPIARSAVLAGRITADTVRLAVVALVIVTVGMLVGFRFEGGVLFGLLMVVVAVAFGSAMCWVQANIGLLVPNVETAQTAGFVWLFPVVFISSVFTPVPTMPDWLQVVARNNPVTLVANLQRALSLGEPLPGATWASMATPVALWIVGLVGVFAPLAVRSYRKV